MQTLFFVEDSAHSYADTCKSKSDACRVVPGRSVAHPWKCHGSVWSYWDNGGVWQPALPEVSEVQLFGREAWRICRAVVWMPPPAAVSLSGVAFLPPQHAFIGSWSLVWSFKALPELKHHTLHQTLAPITLKRWVIHLLGQICLALLWKTTPFYNPPFKLSKVPSVKKWLKTMSLPLFNCTDLAAVYVLSPLWHSPHTELVSSLHQPVNSVGLCSYATHMSYFSLLVRVWRFTIKEFKVVV